ncbi:Tat binding protein 1TBP-1-interacting protein TBPIP [Nitzschia inconspicua]|uniref:Tat binding protein 1TBP-1-interacting protein TBPIP n=1 Tax=Nitzschia inconspicua TaxID=303405 RepID=A0A9K3PTP0_9STRA|nr:Tat binding protein 1TBP-1-interacting protein TBPIP [Nitzschia inconspicua]
MVSDSCDTSDKEIKPSQAEGEEKTMDVSCSTTETTTKKCGLEGCSKNATEIWKDSTTNIEVLLCSDCEKIQGQNMSKVESPSLGLTIEEASSADANLVDEDNAIIATPKSDNKGEEDEQQKQVEEEEEEEEEDEGGSFALIDFVSLAKLKTGGRLCDICIQSHKDDASSPQPILACTVWQSSENPRSKKWYYCLDCLVNDFDSVPDYSELVHYNALKNVNPASYDEHWQFMKTKCSRQRNPSLPDLPTSFLKSVTSEKDTSDEGIDSKHSNFVTPPPKPLRSTMTSSVPSLPLQDSVLPASAVASVKVTPQALAVHKKWQEQAEALGGKGAKIVVNKEKAKEIIYLALKEEFRPMNITEIYKLLKATIPQPVLSSTLKNMADQNGSNPFEDDSDDETKPASKEEAGDEETDLYGRQTLVFKPGKTPQTSLYHFNYKKTKMLDSDERQTLIAALADANATVEGLKRDTASIQQQAAKLKLEPTNVELISTLEQATNDVTSLRDQVADSRKLQVHTGTRIDRQKKIQKMAAQWSKRKRMCLSFLSALEENTDGAVTIQKSLSGDGPLQLDSDEAIVKAELALAKQKSQKRKMGSNRFQGLTKKPKQEPSLSSSLSSDLVAVRLMKGGTVERVYYDEENDAN